MGFHVLRHGPFQRLCLLSWARVDLLCQLCKIVHALLKGWRGNHDDMKRTVSRYRFTSHHEFYSSSIMILCFAYRFSYIFLWFSWIRWFSIRQFFGLKNRPPGVRRDMGTHGSPWRCQAQVRLSQGRKDGLLKATKTFWINVLKLKYSMYIHIYIHYITLHYITLHYITLHYITLHYITLHYITYIQVLIKFSPKSQQDFGRNPPWTNCGIFRPATLRIFFGSKIWTNISTFRGFHSRGGTTKIDSWNGWKKGNAREAP